MTPRPRFLSALGLLVGLAGLAACDDSSPAYIAAADLTRHGFARDEATARRLDGTTVRVWGFVDDANLYGDGAARDILGDLWSGEAGSPEMWRFDLKAHVDDPAGHSFPVYVRNDPDRGRLLSEIVAGARAGRGTKIYVTGTLHTFAARTNAMARTGVYLEVSSSSGVELAK